MKKKFLCLFLTITILFCSVSFSIQAEDDSPAFEWDGHPLIFIQGYSGPKLIRDRGLETEEQVWTFDPLDVVGKVATNLFDIVGSVADYAKGDTAPFVECFRTSGSWSGQRSGTQYFIGNKESKVFHLPTCSHLPAASKQNQMYNYYWIINIAGYTPCKVCLKNYTP